MTELTSDLLSWFIKHGRKNLPWQSNPSNIYHIWVSEVMLQQTKVATVISYFNTFIAQFPTLRKLADADIDEVGSFYLGGDKLQWNTKQTGAIGRMKVDDALLNLVKNMEGYWSVKHQGKDAMGSLSNAYQKGITINEATLRLVHSYFGQYGLVVIQPDDAKLKSAFIPVMEKELLR